MKHFKSTRFVKTLVSLMIVLSLFVTSSIGVVSASEVNTYTDSTVSSDAIIGGADDIQTYPANLVVVDWDATEDEIIIYAQNIGLDTLDRFTGTVNVTTTGKKVSFSATNLVPLATRTITVKCNMTKCFEEIVVEYTGIDNGDEVASGESPGEREIPSSLSSDWTRGNSATVYAAIEQHFDKHGGEVSSTNIVDYARKASAYRSSVVDDIERLSDSKLKEIYNITVSGGATVAYKYKHKTNRQFIILSDSGHYIVSYGI